MNEIPRLTDRDILAIRGRADRYGQTVIGIGLIALTACSPIMGAALWVAISMMMIGAIGVILQQAAITGTSLPFGVALGSDAENLAADLLAATGRRPGSVRFVVVNDPRPNAFASWTPRSRVIAVTSGTLTMLGIAPGQPLADHPSLPALRFLLGHELAHLLFHFPVTLLLRGGATITGLLGPVRWPAQLVEHWWARHTERSADRLGLVLAGSPLASAQIIVGLHQGVLPSHRETREAISRLSEATPSFWENLAELRFDHPFLRPRLSALMAFAETADQGAWHTPLLAEAWRWELAELGFVPDRVAL